MDKNGRGRHIIFTGVPGCGKGTQARILKDKLHIAHLSTGEMLRAEAAKATPLGLEIKALLDRGEFATDDILAQKFGVISGFILFAFVVGHLLNGLLICYQAVIAN